MRAAAIGSCPRSAFSVLVRPLLAAGSKMSYSLVSPCRLLISVLPVDYLTPDVAHAAPELVAPGGCANRPSTVGDGPWLFPCGPVVADCRPSRVHRAAAIAEVMPWHFLSIPLGGARV